MANKLFVVKWTETRVIECFAVVNADSKEEAIKKAQAYEIDPEGNEFVEEFESRTDEIHPPKYVNEIFEE